MVRRGVPHDLHRTLGRAGRPARDRGADALVDDEPDRMTELHDPSRLASGIADSGAVRAVKKLQHAWAHYAEAGELEAMTDLFSRGGRLSLPPREAVGREAIHALLVSAMGHGQLNYPTDRLNVPLFFSPVISVADDGQSARGRWHEIAMTGRFGKRASWSGGIHENEYVLEDGVWKIAVLDFHRQFAGSHRDGWRNVSDSVPLVPFHFTPDSAGLPVTRHPQPRGGDDADAAVLAGLAQSAVDESLVQNVLAAYGHYLDRKLWDDVADLFAPDGVLKYTDEPWTGRERIRAGLETFGPEGIRHGELFDHFQLMPIVTLAPDGRNADVRGVELQLLGQHGVWAHWGVRISEGRLRLIDGRWVIESLRFSPRLLADHAIGWDRDLPRLPENATAYPHHYGPKIGFPHPVRDAASVAPAARAGGYEDAEAALAVARAFDSAENLASAYGYFLDEAHWDESADLFAGNGWKELSFVGTYIGRERIRESLVARYGRRPRRPDFLPIHQKTQPYMTVSPGGDRVQIRLKMLQINSGWETDASIVTGFYEEQMIAEDDTWRIHGMDLDYIVVAEWAAGWAHVAPGLSRKFAPDDETIAGFEPAPDGPLRGLQFAPYPQIGPVGYHYANPVSGREPALRYSWSDGQFGVREG
ncbi:nuclear transport factor 2 family protein [Microbacterium lushaniae]|nr:nuclear transport factor 2 family protein [Microbacterium lushaniae]KAA9159158.1 nuclear transport factor 2 family protein [Microbacterium lushaniae]